MWPLCVAQAVSARAREHARTHSLFHSFRWCSSRNEEIVMEISSFAVPSGAVLARQYRIRAPRAPAAAPPSTAAVCLPALLLPTAARRDPPFMSSDGASLEATDRGAPPSLPSGERDRNLAATDLVGSRMRTQAQSSDVQRECAVHSYVLRVPSASCTAFGPLKAPCTRRRATSPSCRLLLE